MNIIEKEEIITCKSYIPLCDYAYDAPDLDNVPPTGVVHVPMDQIVEFFKRIEGNGHNYIVVSSCSDFGLFYQKDDPPWKDLLKWAKMQTGPHTGYGGLMVQPRLDPHQCHPSHTYSVKCYSWTKTTFPVIPDNVKHWFVTNLGIEDEERCTAIPFGIAEGQRDLFHQIVSENYIPLSKRDIYNDVYVSWQDYTYERYELREWTRNLYGFLVKEPGQPDPYPAYIKQLCTSATVISPPGNGLDCYRTWEAIYAGAHVLTEYNALSRNLKEVPISCYETFSDILDFTESWHKFHLYENMDEYRPLRLSYWKQAFENAREKLT